MRNKWDRNEHNRQVHGTTNVNKCMIAENKSRDDRDQDGQYKQKTNSPRRRRKRSEL
jgi:hypothetical protein